jgi:hypothetical protein
MDWRRTSILFSGLVLVIGLFTFYTFNIGVTVLSFDAINQQATSSADQNTSPWLQILTSHPAVPILDISPDDQNMVQDFDYSQYFILIVSYGYGASTQDSVINIKQHNDQVWIKANMVTPPEGESKTSPYQILKIAKSQMNWFGNITFSLDNEQFEEKARISGVISPAEVASVISSPLN